MASLLYIESTKRISEIKKSRSTANEILTETLALRRDFALVGSSSSTVARPRPSRRSLNCFRNSGGSQEFRRRASEDGCEYLTTVATLIRLQSYRVVLIDALFAVGLINVTATVT